MPRACTICEHAKRGEIEEALTRGVPFRRTAAKYSVSISALSRHLRAHVAEELLAVLRERVDEQRERELAEELGPELVEWMRAEEARFAEVLALIGEGLGEPELEEEGASE